MSTEEGLFLLDLPGVKSQLSDLVIRYCDQVDSTNDWARRVSSKFTGNQSELFLTRHQTAGRGRGDHQWDSSRGSLTFSILIGMFLLSMTLDGHWSLWPPVVGSVSLWNPLQPRPL